MEETGGPRAIEAFSIDGGAAPHYKLYNEDGQSRHTFTTDPLAEKQFTTDDIEKPGRELLAPD